MPSFAVDDGFWYSVPDHLSDEIEVGSIVRVPLSGRRVRGWVVETGRGPDRDLKEIAGVSGALPVFDAGLAKTLDWAATHYVAPLSVLLDKATPPNLPKKPSAAAVEPSASDSGDHVLAGVAGAVARGRRIPVQALVGRWQGGDWVDSLGAVLASGRSVMVVAATAAEVSLVAGWCRDRLGDVVEVSGDDAAELTSAWSEAQVAARVVVGTPRLATWKVAGLGLSVVLEEGRRAMKERQTPTLHVRETLRRRAQLEGFVPAFLGPTPSVELLAAGAEVRDLPGRPWGLVEVVDRSDDPPGSGFLSDRVIAALRATADGGRRSFVFTHRRSGLASMRCVLCRALRACGDCGSYAGRDEECVRCGSPLGPCPRCGASEFEEMGTVPERLVGEIERTLGKGMAQVHPGDTPITVGTERDLAGLEPVTLAVAADTDGMLMGSGYRVAEEALRQLARLAGSVSSTSGSRMMMQTSRPESDLATALRRGAPIPYLESLLVERAREGMPPAVEMIAVEIRGEVPGDADKSLRELEDATVFGPALGEGAHRWILTGELGKARRQLRGLVGSWREQGATVRVDADPIDL